MESKAVYLLLSILAVGTLAQSEIYYPTPDGKSGWPQKPKDNLPTEINYPTVTKPVVVKRPRGVPSELNYTTGQTSNTQNIGDGIPVFIQPTPKPLPLPV